MSLRTLLHSFYSDEIRSVFFVTYAHVNIYYDFFMFIICVCMRKCVCLYVHHMCAGACGGQKRAILELESQVVLRDTT